MGFDKSKISSLSGWKIRGKKSLLIYGISKLVFFMADDAFISGGMEKGTSLAWIIIGNRLFIWNYLSSTASMKCVVLEIPLNVSENRDINGTDRNCWLLCVVNWESTSRRTKKVAKHCDSTGIVLCNQKTQTIIYWPEVYSGGRTAPVTSFGSSEELEVTSSHGNGKATPNKQ